MDQFSKLKHSYGYGTRVVSREPVYNLIFVIWILRFNLLTCTASRSMNSYNLGHPWFGKKLTPLILTQNILFSFISCFLKLQLGVIIFLGSAIIWIYLYQSNFIQLIIHPLIALYLLKMRMYVTIIINTRIARNF